MHSGPSHSALFGLHPSSFTPCQYKTHINKPEQVQQGNIKIRSRAGAFALQGEAEGTAVVQTGKEGGKAACHVPARRSSRLYDRMVHGERVRNNECKLEQDVYTGYKENLLPYEEQRDSNSGFPERWCSLSLEVSKTELVMS